MTNPLLNFDQLPFFTKIEAEYVVPALSEILRESRANIETLCQITTPTWENFALALENIDERISRVWSPVGHLNGVKNSDELRDAYQQGIALLTEYHSEIGQNPILYKQFKILRGSQKFNSLSPAQKKIIDNSILDFQLSGAELGEQDQARLRDINLKLADLSTQFERNVMDSTQAWTYLVTDQEQLKGMPASSVDLAKQMADDSDQCSGQQGWLLSLQIPSYLAVMQHVENAELRKMVYQAYVQRASELTNFDDDNEPQFDNSPLIDQILECKLEKAKLLGFNNYASYSLIKKMASSSDEVTEFLTNLVTYAKPVAEKELTELFAFAKEYYKAEELQPWDVSFYAERLREQRYSFSDEEVKQYFPVPQVLDGMFATVNRLFDITITPNDTMETWHDDVRCYNVIDAKTARLIGQFYTDLYVRKGKRGGAWMDTCVDRRKIGGMIQTPVAFLTCNFSPPVSDDPALLSHGEVETLFHEFGHTLHHLLTEVDEMSVAGINGVAWDAVELPSQFLENWCWQEESLKLIAKHYQTGESIPAGLLEKMYAAKNFQSGMQTLRQVEFASFDMKLHSDYQPEDKDSSVRELLAQVRKNVAVITPPNYNRFENSFGHIFAGGYAAGYYSYKWAEVLSADAFGRFEEEGIFNAQTGQDFKASILQRGGVEDAAVLFKEFRGRSPKIEPLLKQTGILS